MVTSEEFKKNIEAFYNTKESLNKYEEELKSVNSIKNLEEVLKKQGDPSAEINLTAEEQQKLQTYPLLKTIEKLQEKLTLDYLKVSLEGVLRETSTEKLLPILMQYSHDSKDYKKLSNAVLDYKEIAKVYQTYTHLRGELTGNSSRGEEKRFPDIEDIKKYNQVLQNLIEERIRNNGKIKDEKDIKELSEGLVFGSSLNYKNVVLMDESKKRINCLIERMEDKNKVTKYIKERLGKDQDYIECATLLYESIYSKKE